MKEQVQYDGNVIELSDTPAKSRDEVYEEIRILYSAMSLSLPTLRPFVQQLYSLSIELIHWQYDESGKHLAPSDMFAEAILRSSEPLNSKVGQGKPTKFDA
jgi:hypothetical protein